MTEIQIAIDLEQYRQAIQANYKQAAESLIEVGRLLSEVQAQLLDHTSFDSFVETLPFSRRTAFNYLRLHQHYLNHGSAIVALSQINISAWYQLKPDSKAVDRAIERAKQGKKVSKQDVKQIVDSIKFDDARQAEAWHEALETNHNFVLDSMQRGVVTDLDGQDIPIAEADPTLVKVNADQFQYENILRQRNHIQENKPSVGYKLKAQAVRDNHGMIAVGVIIPNWGLDKLDVEVWVSVPVDNENELAEAV